METSDEQKAEKAMDPRSVGDGGLASRALQIDPRRAVCFRGYYGEDFEIEDGFLQRQVSPGLVWADPDGNDAAPDWEMREAWPELARDWERLQAAAWERDRRHTEPSPISPNVRAILDLEPTSLELIDALYRIFAAEASSPAVGKGPPSDAPF